MPLAVDAPKRRKLQGGLALLGLTVVGGIVVFGLSAGGSEQAVAAAPVDRATATCADVHEWSEGALKENVRVFAKVRGMIADPKPWETDIVTEPHLFDSIDTGQSMVADFTFGLPNGEPCDIGRWLTLSTRATQLRLDIDNFYDDSRIKTFEGKADKAIARRQAEKPEILAKIDTYVAAVGAA